MDTDTMTTIPFPDGTDPASAVARFRHNKKIFFLELTPRGEVKVRTETQVVVLQGRAIRTAGGEGVSLEVEKFVPFGDTRDPKPYALRDGTNDGAGLTLRANAALNKLVAAVVRKAQEASQDPEREAALLRAARRLG